MRSLVKLLACVLFATAVAWPASQGAAETLRCKDEKVGPFLDFEYRFVLGSLFSLPVRQFWGTQVELDVDILVEPVNGTPGDAARVADRFRARRPVPEGTKGEVYFSSAVSTGAGQYRASWRIADTEGRWCEGSRLFKAALTRRDRSVEVTLPPGEIVDAGVYLFQPERKLPRPHLRSPRRMKVFVSMDVMGRRGRIVRTRLGHVMPLFSALRQLVRSPSFNEFSLVVFSFEDQEVLFRHDYRDTLDFEGLSGVLKRLKPSTVDLQDLMRGSEVRFFESMVTMELLHAEQPEAVVFLGREMQFGKRISDLTLERVRQLGASFAFLDASRFAWRGVIGSLVRAMSGREHVLRRPADVAKAMEAFERRVLGARPE